MDRDPTTAADTSQEKASSSDAALRVPAYRLPVPDEAIRRLAPAGLRVFRSLAKLLGLSQSDQHALLGLKEGADLTAPEDLTSDQFYRLSYFFGIWMDTATLLGEQEAVKWFSTPCVADKMAGRTAVAYMIEEGLPGFDYLRREAAYRAHNGW